MADVIGALNYLVNMAVIHGGDPGGPYYCNEKRLTHAANYIAHVLGITWEWKEGSRAKEYPVFKGIDVPDELMDTFNYLMASYEIWKRSGNETPLKNALIDAIRFKTDGLSDEDAYKLIKEESHYLTIMKALEKLRKENEDEKN